MAFLSLGYGGNKDDSYGGSYSQSWGGGGDSYNKEDSYNKDDSYSGGGYSKNWGNDVCVLGYQHDPGHRSNDANIVEVTVVSISTFWTSPHLLFRGENNGLLLHGPLQYSTFLKPFVETMSVLTVYVFFEESSGGWNKQETTGSGWGGAY